MAAMAAAEQVRKGSRGSRACVHCVLHCAHSDHEYTHARVVAVVAVVQRLGTVTVVIGSVVADVLTTATVEARLLDEDDEGRAVETVVSVDAVCVTVLEAVVGDALVVGAVVAASEGCCVELERVLAVESAAGVNVVVMASEVSVVVRDCDVVTVVDKPVVVCMRVVEDEIEFVAVVVLVWNEVEDCVERLMGVVVATVVLVVTISCVLEVTVEVADVDPAAVEGDDEKLEDTVDVVVDSVVVAMVEISSEGVTASIGCGTTAAVARSDNIRRATKYFKNKYDNLHLR